MSLSSINLCCGNLCVMVKQNTKTVAKNKWMWLIITETLKIIKKKPSWVLKENSAQHYYTLMFCMIICNGYGVHQYAPYILISLSFSFNINNNFSLGFLLLHKKLFRWRNLQIKKKNRNINGLICATVWTCI